MTNFLVPVGALTIPLRGDTERYPLDRSESLITVIGNTFCAAGPPGVHATADPGRRASEPGPGALQL
jgi:hypothetical protein